MNASTQTEWKTAPADPESAARLAAAGLEYRLADVGDDAALDAWLEAELRGFHAPALDPERVQRSREFHRRLRLAGVWPAGADGQPVATVSGWPMALSMPGGAMLDTWAISAVTVSPLEHGRGIARAMLEGELRTAAALGLPMAGLTVSESTLYGRYGFGIAAEAAGFEIETARVSWTGPVPDGTVDFVDAATAARELAAVSSAALARQPGDVSVREGVWERLVELQWPTSGVVRALRFLRYREPDGTTSGVVVYKLRENERDYTKHTLVVEHLAASTDDAAAALWRALLTQPLVAIVTAELRPVDDPVRWQLRDHRAARVVHRDHHWLRVLDVPRSLMARTYAAPGRVVFAVDDDLGFTAGTYAIDVYGTGVAGVSRVASEPSIRLGIAELASILVGGVSPDTLARAGRIEVRRGDALDLLTRMFATPRAPWLSTWY